MDTHYTILHALTQYDEKQAKRAGHNPWALSHYMGALHKVDADLAAGKELRAAIVPHFCGRLLDVVLKSVGLPKSTDAEQRGHL